jgi:hypothetical protein
MAFNGSQTHRQKVEKQRSVAFRFNRDHLSRDLLLVGLEQIFEVGGFTASPGSVIDDFTLDFPGFEIDIRHTDREVSFAMG